MRDAVQRLLEAEVTTVECHGEQFRFKRLSAAEGLAIQEAGLSEQEPYKYLALVISKTCVEQDGSLGMDSDEWRAKILGLPADTLIVLSTASAEWSGLAESKKN